jgi:hypothetical protein
MTIGHVKNINSSMPIRISRPVTSIEHKISRACRNFSRTKALTQVHEQLIQNGKLQTTDLDIEHELFGLSSREVKSAISKTRQTDSFGAPNSLLPRFNSLHGLLLALEQNNLAEAHKSLDLFLAFINLDVTSKGVTFIKAVDYICLRVKQANKSDF